MRAHIIRCPYHACAHHQVSASCARTSLGAHMGVHIIRCPHHACAHHHGSTSWAYTSSSVLIMRAHIIMHPHHACVTAVLPLPRAQHRGAPCASTTPASLDFTFLTLHHLSAHTEQAWPRPHLHYSAARTEATWASIKCIGLHTRHCTIFPAFPSSQAMSTCTCARPSCSQSTSGTPA